jgi:hypothetical protein
MPSKIKTQPKNPQELQQWLESQGIKVKPQSEWGQTLNNLQRQADRTGAVYTAQITIPVKPSSSSREYVRAWGQSNQKDFAPIGADGPGFSYSDQVRSQQYAPPQRSTNRPMQGPSFDYAQAPAQGFVPGNPYAAPAYQAPRAGYHFTGAQPPLPAPEEQMIRNQYAQAVSQGGNFVTPTNQGLLSMLQQAGIRSTALADWQNMLSVLNR